eukprot:CAMPEP_0184495844 /NCGR_PEP_ID=MMETSP0113_2-20130426/32486_1 /TAXON_ID=91329 /ORGANISM="Norrisiella sphaerica, Strain BC52" /LENGTH=314 /DNA_ID=CAMNT_0026882219 /DNA_START=37 /DNA_END=981 /DNA_ORIENTATION=-
MADQSMQVHPASSPDSKRPAYGAVESKTEAPNTENAYEDVTNSEGEGFMTSVARCIIIFFAAIIAIIPISWFWCITILREYERAVHFRLGKVYGAAKGPGIFFFLPFVDEYRVVDLRITALDVPPQEMITKDSVTTSVNAVVFIRVVDPNRMVLQVDDYITATKLLAQTTLRSVVGQHELDELLSKRDRINNELMKIIDKDTDVWGVKVFATEISDVKLPLSMQRAMASQAESERTRRAKVISAEGEYQASELLQKAAKTLQAEPLSIQLRYLHTLTQVSAEKNSTIIFPVPVDVMPLLNKKTSFNANAGGPSM